LLPAYIEELVEAAIGKLLDEAGLAYAAIPQEDDLVCLLGDLGALRRGHDI